MNDTRPTITIKLRPHLQEFVLAELRGSSLASGYQIIGKLVRPFIRYRPVDVNPKFERGANFITFTLPFYSKVDLRHKNFYISEQNQRVIENLLDAHFKKIFYNYMKDKVRFDNRNFTVCILQFCYDYDFCYDNINFEMLKKFFYRERKKDKNNGNVANNLSRCCPDVVPINKKGDFPFLMS